MPTSQTAELLDQLSRNSVPYADPLARLDWSQLDREQAWLPETALSLYGLPEFRHLDDEQRLRLSQLEFLNLIEGGLWLEGLFIRRLSKIPGRSRHNLPQQIYRLHELREETGHSLMFLELLRRALPLQVENRFHDLRTANWVARYAPMSSAMFWMAVLIGEEVPDRMNRLIRKQRDEVCPLISDMVSIHIIDEARHIAHARQTLAARLPVMPGWQKRLLRPLIQRVFRQFVLAFYFPPAQVYEAAGLADGHSWAAAARRNPYRIAFVEQCVQSSAGLLREHGLPLRWR